MTNGKKIILSIIGLIGGYAIYKGISKEPSKYSLEWIKGLSKERWNEEREIVQNQYRNPLLDIDLREEFRRILRLFDMVQNERDGAGKTPQGPVYHREHGTNLYKPD